MWLQGLVLVLRVAAVLALVLCGSVRRVVAGWTSWQEAPEGRGQRAQALGGESNALPCVAVVHQGRLGRDLRAVWIPYLAQLCAPCLCCSSPPDPAELYRARGLGLDAPCTT